ncbi:ketopantoate reductase [Leifsonia sp. ALI-44-B]|uniref:ketopantoate reductase family protein n=1 Tax=Leifsonia sp. ALI-44-B TaxID=1933776 RepID=UPI00097C0146|nr:2-dehydropantoate 2-reductase N-terminal domain-containing protein [Leifsonia sp. ALI-44-B]ONI60672.1 ketopantoate reductase [Leifsonia sp. ALI-44-B]
MKILMFGRGVIATIYGRAFQAAGHEVDFYVRPGRAADYSTDVQMEIIDGRLAPLGRETSATFAPRLRESIDPGDEFDLVVLSVGHHRLSEAAAFLAPRIGAAPVLVFGNIWQEPLDAIAPLPADQVVFGFPQAGGGFDENGVLRGALVGSVILGASNTAATKPHRVARAAFAQAGIGGREEEDMRGWLMLHVALDAGMFSQALRVGGLAKMVGDPRALRGAFLTSRELLPVLAARGVDLRRHRAAAIPTRFPLLIGALTAAASAALPIARASLAAHTDPNAAEPRAVLDDTLRTARELGIAVPRLEHALRGA